MDYRQSKARTRSIDDAPPYWIALSFLVFSFKYKALLSDLLELFADAILHYQAIELRHWRGNL